MMGPIAMLRGRDLPRPASAGAQSPRPHGAFRRALRDRPFLQLGLAYLLLLSASGAVTSAIPYFVTRLFARNDSDIGTALLVMLVATTVTVTWWGRLGRRHGELRVLQVAVIAYALAALAIGALALLQAPWSLALFGFALLGIPFGAMQVLPFTLVATLIHAGSAHDHSTEGTSTGIWTATEKLGLALGPTITGLTLWIAGAGSHAVLAVVTITAAILLMAGSIAALRSVHMPSPAAAA
jgi:Na+/melibiose symporter-like transporter